MEWNQNNLFLPSLSFDSHCVLCSLSLLFFFPCSIRSTADAAVSELLWSKALQRKEAASRRTKNKRGRRRKEKGKNNKKNEGWRSERSL
jgi:hypothetical protein